MNVIRKSILWARVARRSCGFYRFDGEVSRKSQRLWGDVRE